MADEYEFNLLGAPKGRAKRSWWLPWNMHLGFFEPKKHGGDCWLHGGLEPPCVSDVFTEGHLLVQCLCWIGFLVSETGSVMMQLRMILNLYSSYIYVYRPRGSNMHPPVSSRHVQPQRIHENYLCILDQTGSSLCITKMHDAVQVSVYIYIYTSLNLGLLIFCHLIMSRVFQNLTWPSQNVHGG